MKILNKIPEAVEKYQQRTGATKKFIYNKLRVTRQRFEKIEKAESLTEEVYKNIAKVLECEYTDLYIVELEKNENYIIKD